MSVKQIKLLVEPMERQGVSFGTMTKASSAKPEAGNEKREGNTTANTFIVISQPTQKYSDLTRKKIFFLSNDLIVKVQNQRRTRKAINNFETSYFTFFSPATQLKRRRWGRGGCVLRLPWGERKDRFNEGKEGGGKERNHCYGKWMEIHDEIFSRT
ncbi:hypothetical protein K0M31_020336 [Melipona bicolor]|uniref:Uncharacterized protein n=1 Tax=Melipona bicolor TaxID=60889 RepID=A0AA40KQM7_9HYME|nr:hypothetical protein K0M31_020336 [Melipona bicolor]